MTTPNSLTSQTLTEASPYHSPVDSALLTRLQRLASNHSVALYSVVYAAYAALVGRWSQQYDTVLATAITGGLAQAGGQPAHAAWDNVAVLRNKLQPQQGFDQWLASCQKVVNEATLNSDIPFKHLLSELDEHEDLLPGKLFFALSENAEQTRQLVSQKLDQCDLALIVETTATAPKLLWHYSPAAFEQSSVQSLSASLQVLLQAIVADSSAAISQLPLLSQHDRQQLDSWNNSQADFAANQTLSQLFEAQAVAYPDNIAVVYHEGDQHQSLGAQLSYQQLNAQANQLAVHLQQQGVTAEVLVGICVERSAAMMVAILAILKAGGAYVPLDPTYPDSRLAYMVNDSGISLTISQSSLQTRLATISQQPLVVLDDLPTRQTIAAQPSVNVVNQATPTSLAYVIYTSGSTGQPKGVALEHRGAVNLAFNQQHLFDVTSTSRVMHFASIGFDAGTWDWLMALTTGASLFICPDSGRASPQLLGEFLLDHQISHATLPPTLLGHLDSQPDYALKALIVAGEACDPQLGWQWAKKVRLFNAYGPSETTVCASVDRVVAGQTITIGRVLNNFSLDVVDQHNQPLPIGATGELMIGGVGLARGYLNKPGQTASAFITLANGQQRYKTGDLVRFLPNGKLEYLGRIDDQVKIRGFRIELGEIEHQLTQQPGIQDALVLAREDISSQKQLVGYIVAQAPGNESVWLEQLKTTLAQHLPDYMVPAVLVRLDKFPLTVNGKVDKQALPKPQAGNVYVAPQSEVEQRLAEVWSQVLGLATSKVGINDNFFSLGGDSILATQVVARANRIGLKLTTELLLKSGTIARLAGDLDSVTVIKVSQAAVTGQQTLLPIQQSFLKRQSHPEALHHFNQSVLLTAPADLNQQRLESLITALHQRHDGLRQRFSQDNHGRWQAAYITNNKAITEVETLSDSQLPDNTFIASRCDHYQRSLNITTGPVFAAVLFKAPKQARLLLLAHHLVMDAVSWRTMIEDIKLAYEQDLIGLEIKLTDKTTSYQQWANVLAEQSAGLAQQNAFRQAQNAFWQAQNAEFNLPVDHQVDGPITEQHSQHVVYEFEQHWTRELVASRGAYNTHTIELLLAGVYLGFSRWSTQRHIPLMLEGHGRETMGTAVDLSETVGWFTAVYPLLLGSDSSDIGSVIKAIKEQYRAVPDGGTGYSQQPVNTGSNSNNRPQILFNFLGQFDASDSSEGLFTLLTADTGNHASPHKVREYALGLNCVISAGRLQLSLDHSDNQFNQDNIARLKAALVAGLQDVVSHCDQQNSPQPTPSDFPLADVSQQQLDSWQQQFAIEQLYPATPMQKGMMFHTLVDQAAYVTQTHFTFNGDINLALFQQAWQGIVERFEVFRTVFVGEGEQLQQLVVKQAQLPWVFEDWQHLIPAQQTQKFDHYRQQDKQAGFALSTSAPLTRVSIFRLAQQRYQMLWSHHHMLLDGWSLPLVYGAVIENYQRLCNNLPVNLQQQGKFADYIGWLASQDNHKAELYWQQQMQGFDAPTPLHIDRLPTDADNKTGHHALQHNLDKAQTERLQAFARQHQITPYAMLQFAWGYLLHRYSGEQQVLFGSIVSGRPGELAGVEGIVGLFINNIPVTLTIDPQQSLIGQLQQLHHNFQQANSHSYLPLNKIHSFSGIERGITLFDSLLAFENYPLDAAVDAEKSSQQKVELSLEAVGAYEENDYKLTLNAGLGETLEVRCGYRREQFAEQTITRLLGHLFQILAQLPDCKQPADIQLLTEAENQLQQQWCQAQQQYQADTTIHQHFEQQVALNPDATALILDKQTLSYQALNRQANQLAHYLIGQGVQPDTLVGLCVDRSMAMIVGILAILKAGGAYVPLDPEYPVPRLQHMLDDSAIEIVLSCSHLLDSTPLDQQQVILLDDNRLYGHCPVTNPQLATLRPEHLAYVIYTSGSTGKPKGVLVEHRNVVRLFSASNRDFCFSANDSWSLFHSISFDFSVWEIWGALACGGRLVIVPKITAQSPGLFYQLVAGQGVTVLSQTPAAFEQFAQQDSETQAKLSLRYVVFGGAALTTSSLLPWMSRHGDQQPQLINMYGITETTVHVTFKQIAQADALAARGSVIGVALADLSTHVFDGQFNSLPVGIPGELFVGGGGVARGYLNRAELTAERFIAHPADPQQRLYRTGDLVRRLPDGELDYLGRMDDQVKIRGFRIELGEIEHQLLAQDSVREALVITYGEGLNSRLIAYIVPATKDMDTGALNKALQQSLPDYMIPSAFVAISRLPLTVNGKIDKKALPEPVMTSGSSDYIAPQTDHQRQMAVIWQAALALEQISIDDNFFAVGGDSIRAIPLVAQLKKAGFNVSIRLLFENPSIETLAAAIAGTDDTVETLEQLAQFALVANPDALDNVANKTQLEDAYPMTKLQQGMVFHNLLAGGQGTYHDVMSFHLKGQWHYANFAAALTALVARHPILRTIFEVSGEQPLQLVYNQMPDSLKVDNLEVEDLSALSAAEQAGYLTKWIEQEKNSAFDFSKPLWRICIHQLGNNDYQYNISFHHALFDGWSVASLNTELFNGYMARNNGETVAVQAPPLAYKYFVYLEQQAINDQAIRDYWSDKLEGLSLPWWAGRPQTVKLRQVISLDVATSDKMVQLAKTVGVPERSVLLSTHMVLMALINGQSDVVTSVVTNGRPEFEGGDQTLGLFLNSLPFRLNTKTLSWQALIKAVDAQVSQDSAARRLPLAQIQADSGFDFSASLFNYVDFHVYQNLQQQVEVLDVQGALEQNYLIGLTYSKMSNGTANYFDLTIDADQAVFEQPFIQRIAGYCESIIATMLDQSQQPIILSNLIGQQENQLQLQQWNQTQQPYDAVCIHQLFAQQAQKTPHQIAVKDSSVAVTYQQLEQAANRLANDLHQQGMSGRIGVYMQRCPQLLVALLGIMKAGCTYVPLDMKNTADRLTSIIADAGIGQIISMAQDATMFSGADVQIINLDNVFEQDDKVDLTSTSSSQADPDSSAYLIYTSGSTGVPKGVEIAHSSLTDYCLSALNHYYQPQRQPQPLDGSLVITSHGFDITIPSLYLPLLKGDTVSLLPADGELSALASTLAQPQCPAYLLRMTPMHVNGLLALLPQDFHSNSQHVFVIGGESFAPTDARQLQSRFGNSTIHNHYGPSEAVVGCAMFNFTGQQHQVQDVIPIGQPMANTRLYVLSDQHQPVPVGCVGELYIGGAGLARGYLNQPALTAASFINHGDFGRVYKTGDLVRWSADGNLIYMGRTDHQVKIRGFRIELGEIEQQLLQQPGVEAALVVAREDDAGGSRLVAYVTANQPVDDEKSWLNKLRSALIKALPNYMVPAALVCLDALPLSANGKINRKALPEPQFNQTEAYVEPVTDTEQQLALIYGEILHLSQVSATANFFALGGHSLNATRVVSAVRQQFEVDLPLVEMFNQPDLQAIGKVIDELLTIHRNQQVLDDQSDDLMEMEW